MRRLVSRAILPASTVCVLACTALLLTGPRHTGSLTEALGWHPRSASAEHTAVVVLRPQDCSSNLEFLRLFARPRLASRLSVTALVIGSADEVSRAEARLAGQGLRFPTERLSRRAAVALASLGYEQTPFMVVFDRAGRVRVAAGVPQSFAEMTALGRLLEDAVADHPEA